MTHDSRPTTRGAVAGSLLLATIAACALIGLGVGALIGSPALLMVVGVCVGVPAGTAVVRARFRDL